MTNFRPRPVGLFITLLLIAPLLAACGTPAIAGVPTAIAMVPTTAAPTAIPLATNAPVNVASPTPTSLTPFIVDWALFGTPTRTPTNNGMPTNVPTLLTNTPVGNSSSNAAPPATNPPPDAASPTHVAAIPTTQPAANNNAVSSGGNPANGKPLFNTVGCSGCHDVSAGVTIVGPSLVGIASRGATRITGMSAAAYIHQHIVNPAAYTVQGFAPGIMPSTFGQTLTASQIDDLVAYLMTLK